MKKITSLILILIGLSILYLSLGAYPLSIQDWILFFQGQSSKAFNFVLFSHRLPRLLLALLVGNAFAISGHILQSISKNDLAEPSILGIQAGAALAAVLFIHSKNISYYQDLGQASFLALPFLSFIGASLSTLILLWISGIHPIHPKRLILMGLGLQAGLNAIILWFSFKGGLGEYNRLLTWLSGSLWGTNWLSIGILILIQGLSTLYLIKKIRVLDVLLLSDDHVLSLGLKLSNERLKLIGIILVLSATAVAFAGNIGYLGLLAPHISKRLRGTLHKNSLISTSLIGMIIIVIADAIARNAFSPIELPVGLLISLVAVPYFIHRLLKENFNGTHSA